MKKKKKLFDLVLEAREEILQIFQLLFWRIDVNQSKLMLYKQKPLTKEN